MILVGVFGVGGYAREVMPIARQTVIRKFNSENNCQLVFVTADEPDVKEVNGHKVISERDFFSADVDSKFFNVAVADSRLRQNIVESAISYGAFPLQFQADNSVIFDNNEISDGAIISPSVIITSNAKIGCYFHANLFSYVAHDCVIGDYVTFAPNVHCNGNVEIKDHAYIGTGVILKQGKKDRPIVIGEGAVVGMGAVVTKNVPPYTTVVGNPARILVRK